MFLKNYQKLSSIALRCAELQALNEQARHYLLAHGAAARDTARSNPEASGPSHCPTDAPAFRHGLFGSQL